MLTVGRYSERTDPRRGVGAITASLLLHLGALLLFLLQPKSDVRADLPQAATIVDPPRVLVSLTETKRPPEVETPEVASAADSEGGVSDGPLDVPGAPVVVANPEVAASMAPAFPVATAEAPLPAGSGTTASETGPLGGSGASAGTGAGGGSGAGKGSGAGVAASGGQGLYQMADWIVRPTDADMQKANPFLARQKGVSGTVLLSCQVSDANRAKNCKTIKEDPRGYGFASAARSVVRRGLIRPPVAGKRDAEDRVMVSITFKNYIAGDVEEEALR